MSNYPRNCSETLLNDWFPLRVANRETGPLAIHPREWFIALDAFECEEWSATPNTRLSLSLRGKKRPSSVPIFEARLRQHNESKPWYRHTNASRRCSFSSAGTIFRLAATVDSGKIYCQNLLWSKQICLLASLSCGDTQSVYRQEHIGARNVLFWGRETFTMSSTASRELWTLLCFVELVII